MRICLALAVALAASPAAAEPRCNVTIAYAPADVRAVVEAWINGEPHCVVSLEIRIVPTAGGYYLYARDAQGRVRERIVPDAHTAGVLVASWVADDRTSAPRPPQALDPEVVPALSVPARESELGQRWLSLGLTADGHRIGARAELDVFVAGRWAAGLAASVNNALGDRNFGSSQAAIDARYLKALAYLAPKMHLGRWHARPMIAVGIVYATGMVYQSEPLMSSLYDVSTTYATAQGGLMVGRLIGDNWSIHGGAIASLPLSHVETFELADGRQVGPTDLVMQDPRFVWYLGVQRRLW